MLPFVYLVQGFIELLLTDKKQFNDHITLQIRGIIP